MKQNPGWWQTALFLPGIIALLLAPLPLYAQESTDEPADTESATTETPRDEVEEIVVTGTRIGRSNVEEFAHISVLSSEDITLSGVTTVDELLNDMPSVTLQGINKQLNNGGAGLAFVDLRNLGSGRTLVLVNGRRFIGSTGSGTVDLNNIPLPMIERVEVLLDGASAAYGSDAIGGVVNVLLKDDFEGAHVEATGGITDKGDGAEVTASATVGTNSEKGNLTASFMYMRRNHIHQKDRDWSKILISYEWLDSDGNRQQGIGSGYPPPGRAMNNNMTFIPDPETGRSFIPFTERYNYAELQYLVPEMDRYSITLVGHYDFAENARLYAEGTYTNRHSRAQMAGEPIGYGTPYFRGELPIPVTHPHVPADYLVTLDPGEAIIDLVTRSNQIGPRIFENDAETFRTITGVKGDIGDFTWDVFLNYGQNHDQATDFNRLNLARVWDTVNPELCELNSKRGCVLGDWFGVDDLQDEVVKYVEYSPHTLTYWEQLQLGTTVVGDLVELPGGTMGMAVGAETRKLAGYNRPDSVISTGETAGNVFTATEGSYHAQEVFGEVSLPFIKDMPGASEVTLDLAGRFSHYSTFGDALTYRAGLSWAPLKDIRLRGVYSTAFRAPTISNLYGGSSDSYIAVKDPCDNWGTSDNANIRTNCAAQNVPPDYSQIAAGTSQMRANVGSNPLLDAEDAQVFNVGLVFTPRFLPGLLEGLSITFDYYNIIMDNAITSPNAQYVLDSCYQSQGMQHENCGRIADRTERHVLRSLDLRLQNVAKIETSGFDFTIDYGTNLGFMGLPETLRLDVQLHGNYLLRFVRKQEGTEAEERHGTIEYEGGTYAHLRWLFSVALSGENWSFKNRLRYIQAADIYEELEEIHSPTRSVPDVIYWDLVAQYTWDSLYFVAGVDNLLDKEPPFMPKAIVNGNTYTYDFIGRYVFTKVGYKF